MPTDVQVHFDAVKVIDDWRTHLVGEGLDETPEGSSPPPEGIEESLDYFTAVHAGHHTRFRALAGYVRTRVYEAVNGHRDYANGTPIASWAGRAKYDKQELVRVFDALRDIMVM